MLQIVTTELSELQVNFRNETIDTLKLISSETEQLDYQQKVPIADVSSELFCSWESCYQDVKSRDWYQSAFSTSELGILARFDVVFEEVCSNTEEKLPYITDFIKTKQWLKLSNAAKQSLLELTET